MMAAFTFYSLELHYYIATPVYLRIQAKILNTSQELCTQWAFNFTYDFTKLVSLGKSQLYS